MVNEKHSDARNRVIAERPQYVNHERQRRRIAAMLKAYSTWKQVRGNGSHSLKDFSVWYDLNGGIRRDSPTLIYRNIIFARHTTRIVVEGYEDGSVHLGITIGSWGEGVLFAQEEFARLVQELATSKQSIDVLMGAMESPIERRQIPPGTLISDIIAGLHNQTSDVENGST